MKFSIIKEYEDTIVTPERGTGKSAGIDFYCPLRSEHFLKRLQECNEPKDFGISYRVTDSGIMLSPGSRIRIPIGLKVKLPENTAFIGYEKSGLACNSGIIPTCRVIDEDYQGEICIGLHNIAKKDYVIKFGSKIGQCVLVPVIYESVEIVPENELYESVSERGEGGFGSTGI